MLNYLHHIIFDPLSVWEKFKADALFSFVMLCALGLLFLWFKRNPK